MTSWSSTGCANPLRSPRRRSGHWRIVTSASAATNCCWWNGPRAAKPIFATASSIADGGEVAQCGNGARCFARFVVEEGLTAKREIMVETRAGLLRLYLENDGQVRVNMGVPRLAPAEIPLLAAQQALRYPLGPAPSWQVGAISMGNPHAVLAVPAVATAPVGAWGPAIQALPDFPEGVNVGFMETVARDHIRLRVFERGSGETLACGSGACAAVVIGRLWGELEPDVSVDLPGGRLRIHWAGAGEPVWMTGPAVRVFDGQLSDGPA